MIEGQKGCPFCGAPPTVRAEKGTTGYYELECFFYVVHCSKYCCSTKRTDSVEAALNFWNTRVG